MSSVHDRLKQKLAGARAGFGWKCKDGDNKIFVLPPGAKFVDNLDAVEALAFQYKAHWFRMGDGRPPEVSRCLADLHQRCPACVVAKFHGNSPNPELKEMARQIRAADQYVFNVLDLNDVVKGVQRWGANWTCWTKIMEIASNPAWGYVYDPRNGVAFIITLTPGNRSRTGYNSYSIMPEPARLSVLEVLTAGPDGLNVLDGLEDAPMEAKTPEDIAALLEEIGLPPTGQAIGSVGNLAGPHSVAAPAAPRVVRPLAVPVLGTVERSREITEPTPAALTAPATGVHYDPGPAYQEKVPVAERPAGAPRCFGDYKPSVHRCQPCPVLAGCQMKLLGIV